MTGANSVKNGEARRYSGRYRQVLIVREQFPTAYLRDARRSVLQDLRGLKASSRDFYTFLTRGLILFSLIFAM